MTRLYEYLNMLIQKKIILYQQIHLRVMVETMTHFMYGIVIHYSKLHSIRGIWILEDTQHFYRILEDSIIMHY